MDNILFYLRRILFIIRKEFLATVNDPKSRVILVVPAIIQTLLFGYVASFNLDRVDYALLDMSHSHYSEELAAHLDGSGISHIETGIGFFDHMLDGMARHGLFDLTVKVNGDLDVDCHHTI